MEIITPLYTGINPLTKNLQGIMVNRGRIPYEYMESKMHHTPSNEESIVEGVIFYSEGRGRADQNRAPNDGQDPDSIKNQIKDRKEGIVRINIDELIENTDLSFSGKEDIAR